jgi:multisubunit Na+/H+ antiporter MnhF subunit
MNEWELVAAILAPALLVCGAVCALASPADGLVALELAGTITTTVLMLLAEGLRRQPFIDLAVVFAVLSLVGALVIARLLEHDL